MPHSNNNDNQNDSENYTDTDTGGDDDDEEDGGGDGGDDADDDDDNDDNNNSNDDNDNNNTYNDNITTTTTITATHQIDVVVGRHRQTLHLLVRSRHLRAGHAAHGTGHGGAGELGDRRVGGVHLRVATETVHRVVGRVGVATRHSRVDVAHDAVTRRHGGGRQRLVE